MTRILLIVAFFLTTFFVKAQNYKPSDAGSKVHFVIKNFGINTGGDLSGLNGNIIFSPAAITKCSFDVTVTAGSIDTDNKTRDEHLKGKEYFDAEKYPVIRIQSSKINRTNKSAAGWYYFTGTITMHGVTKPVTFPFAAVQKGGDVLFTGSFSINRLDFGVGSSSAVLSNNVKISLTVLAKKNLI